MPPSGTQTRVTREEIVRLGRASKPWAFLPLAARALDVAPTDLGVRFLIAANLGKLGLKSLAAEQLDALGEASQSNPDVVALRAAVEALPADRVSAEERIELARGNVEALSARGIDLREAFEAWQQSAREIEAFRCADGNIVRRTPGSAMSSWIGLFDAQAHAREVVRQIFAKPEPYQQPITIEGIDPPRLVQAIAQASPPTEIGYQPRVDLVQASISEFFDGLSFTDLRPILSQDRVRVWVGPKAGAKLGEWFTSQTDTRAVGVLVQSPLLRTRVVPPLQTLLPQATRSHEAGLGRDRLRAEQYYLGRDAKVWAQRYDEALSGRGEPLRVLVCSSLLSTYIRHAAGDLAAAINDAGHQAELLMEPDRYSRISAWAYWKRLADFKPDMVLLINYTRFNMKDVVPPGVPFVCWSQDPMPHLFHPQVGAAQGPLDFLVGNAFHELYQRFGYPLDQALPGSLVASTRKFHDRPVDPELLREHQADVAFVSHHGETPDQLHERLLKETVALPALAGVFRELKGQIEGVLNTPMQDRPTERIIELAERELAKALGREVEANLRAIVVRQYALSLADRIFRHQAVEWSTRICARRGWKLALYGKGWDRIPAFAPFARGTLDHGEALRASYQAAALHLHVSFNTVMHQRVLECALSGGLPSARLHSDFCATPKYLHVELLNSGLKPLTDAAGRIGWPIDAHPVLAEFVSMRTRLGLSTLAEDGVLWITADRHKAILNLKSLIGPQHNAWALLGDPATTCFWDEASLEARIEAAVERGPARRDAIAGIRSRALAGYTHDVLAKSMMTFVRDRLAAAGR